MHTAPEKSNIYAKFYSECDPGEYNVTYHNKEERDETGFQASLTPWQVSQIVETSQTDHMTCLPYIGGGMLLP